MIRTQEMVPDWYVEKSRDFQILCRLYDLALNSLKYNIDTMQSLTDTRSVKDTVLPLVGNKFGIYDKDAYANRYMLEALPIATKYKGSLKAVNILINAFLDSMDVFDFATVLHSKDEATAAEISEYLNREIKPYSLVIIFSTFPSLSNLHVLNEYLNRVLPSGMLLEYAFGQSSETIEKFKYKEYVVLLYTHEAQYGETMYPYVGFVKNKNDKYKATFELVNTTNIHYKTETITVSSSSWTPTYTPVPVPPATDVIVNSFVTNPTTGEVVKTRIFPDATTGKYTVTAGATIGYYYNRENEFFKEQLSDIDINSVSLAMISSGED